MNTVGIVGLGIIGTALAGNLLDDGFTVVGCDLEASARHRLRDLGGTPLEHPADVAASADVVLIAVATPGALLKLVDGPTGLAATHGPGPVVVNLSTLPVDEVLRAGAQLARAHIPMVDATISGTGAQARQRNLAILVSGEDEVVARVTPLLARLGRVHDVGRFGDASRTKLVANLLVAVHDVAAAEALLLADRLGLDASRTLEVVADGAGDSRMWRVRGPLMIAGNYDPPTARLGLLLKDLELVLAQASATGIRLPVTEAAREVHRRGVTQGLGDLDAAAVRLVLETDGSS